jgi:hypothetical protein
MKPIWVIAILFLPAFLVAGEKPAGPEKDTPPPLKLPHAPRSWLGLQVSKPDQTITAHLPALPPGIGFVIQSINKDGPAESAGLRDFDVIWKIGDQMLVNEGQLAALLRLSKPGDEVKIAGFRAGKEIEVKLKLGEAPASQHPYFNDMVDDTVLPRECRGPMRISDFNLNEKLASYTTDEGRAEVRKVDDLHRVKIQGPDGKVIFEGDFPKDGSLDKVPDRWKRRIYALRRGLDHALEGGMPTLRQPRPRVVPPADVRS